MSMPFDATMKDMVLTFLADYAEGLNFGGPLPLSALNSDLSTITAATDIAIGRGDPLDSIVDINFQSGRADDVLSRVLLYNTLLHHKYRVPVHSLIVLLRPEANDLRLEAGLHYSVWPERGSLDFKFEVIRLWEIPVEKFLSGPLGTLPLATLCQLPAGTELEKAIAQVVRKIEERLLTEANSEVAGKLWTATFVLSGLRLSKEVAKGLFKGGHGMHESTTYQMILEEGEAKGAASALKRTIRSLGDERFGPPGQSTKAVLDSLNDPDRLERIAARVNQIGSWEELLKTQ